MKFILLFQSSAQSGAQSVNQAGTQAAPQTGTQATPQSGQQTGQQSDAQTGVQTGVETGAPPAAQTDAQAATQDNEPVLIIPGGNNGEPHKITIDGTGLHISQGTSSTTIPLGKVIPPGAVQIAWALTAIVAILAIWLPLSRFVFRRLDRRRNAALNSRQMEQLKLLEARLSALEQNIDTVAVEVERVSEAQRFTSRQLQGIGKLPEQAFVAAPDTTR